MRSSARSKLSKKPSQVQEDSSPEPVTVGVFRVSNARPEEVAKKVETNVRNEESRELPELKPKDPKWRKHYNEVKNKMGNLPAIHGEQQNRIHEILRVFDNSYEYGPCVGVPRLERWNRAKALGLTPPKEVEEILKTKQGSTMPEYTESVFYGEV
ncbi:DNA polymerase delta, subunit 4-domain-containing protein [Flammula alnicola]|nr:DNA polymerase delta, subunit 4-domain-containing protein [Flammula alnicola]